MVGGARYKMNSSVASSSMRQSLELRIKDYGIMYDDSRKFIVNSS